MTRKPMSWTKTSLVFLLMASIYVGGVMAFLGIIAHITHIPESQIWPMRSHFLRFYLPYELCLLAFIAVCIRFGYNRRPARKNRADLPQSQTLRGASLNRK